MRRSRSLAVVAACAAVLSATVGLGAGSTAAATDTYTPLVMSTVSTPRWFHGATRVGSVDPL